MRNRQKSSKLYFSWRKNGANKVLERRQEAIDKMEEARVFRARFQISSKGFQTPILGLHRRFLSVFSSKSPKIIQISLNFLTQKGVGTKTGGHWQDGGGGEAASAGGFRNFIKICIKIIKNHANFIFSHRNSQILIEVLDRRAHAEQIQMQHRDAVIQKRNLVRERRFLRFNRAAEKLAEVRKEKREKDKKLVEKFTVKVDDMTQKREEHFQQKAESVKEKREIFTSVVRRNRQKLQRRDELTRLGKDQFKTIRMIIFDAWARYN